MWHRRRMRLILEVPVLLAHSMLRFAEWRQVIADFVAERTGQPGRTLLPQTIALRQPGRGHRRLRAVAARRRRADRTAGRAMRDLARAFADGTVADGGP